MVRESLRKIKPSAKDEDIIKSLLLRTPWTAKQQDTAISIISKYQPNLNIFSLKRELVKEELLIKHRDYSTIQIQAANDIKNGKQLDITVPLKTKLFDHQVKAFEIGTTLDACAYYCEVGTGKTLAAIATAGKRYMDGEIKKLLVIAPVSVLHVWSNEFEKHAKFPFKISKTDTTNLPSSKNTLNIFCISYESAWRYADNIYSWKPDMVICDESQRIKNIDSNRSKFLHELGTRVKYKLILSGTPITQGSMDIFSQYKFLNSSIFGDSYSKFKDKYCVLGKFNEIIGYKNIDDISKKVHSIAYRVRKQDVLNLPEISDQTLYCSLSETPQEIYNTTLLELKSYFINNTVDICNVLPKLIKLAEITGGFIKVSENDIDKIVPIGTEKLTLLKDFVTDLPSDTKFIIIARFLHEIRYISEILDSMNISNHIINGSVSSDIRKDLEYKFQNNTDPRCLILQSTIGIGMTLTAANVMIFYSNDYSYDSYVQSRGRIHRPGQKNNCLYINLVCKNTIDEKILESLERKKNFAGVIIDGNGQQKLFNEND